MKREPWTIEFNQERVKRTPEEYVMAANVRRRHLTPGQTAHQDARERFDAADQTPLLRQHEVTIARSGGRPNSCVTSRQFATGFPTSRLEYQSLVLDAGDIRDQSFLVGNFLDLDW
jgi:hypothetical protein